MVDEKELEEKEYYRKRLSQWRELGFDVRDLEIMLELRLPLGRKPLPYVLEKLEAWVMPACHKPKPAWHEAFKGTSEREAKRMSLDEWPDA